MLLPISPVFNVINDGINFCNFGLSRTFHGIASEERRKNMAHRYKLLATFGINQQISCLHINKVIRSLKESRLCYLLL